MTAKHLIHENKIRSRACELSVVDHCNLSCSSCSHFSPILKRSEVPIGETHDALTKLSRVYHAECIRFVGGEPLLHSKLIPLLEAVRSTGVADKIRIVTNGLLLSSQPDEFWNIVDEVFISEYPGRALTEDMYKQIALKSSVSTVAITRLFYDRFRVSYSELGTNDQTLVERIYRSCQITHIWQCHTIAGGHFYRCPQALLIPKATTTLQDVRQGDGILITDKPGFLHELVTYLESDVPPAACSKCLGSAGRLIANTQISRSAWRIPHRRTTEELVDYEYLRVIEEDPYSDNGCLRSPFDYRTGKPS